MNDKKIKTTRDRRRNEERRTKRKTREKKEEGQNMQKGGEKDS